jgi:hypothetical protein
VLAPWNNSPRVDMSLHFNTPWFQANQPLLLLLRPACLQRSSKYQFYSLWFDQNRAQTHDLLHSNMHTITPPMRFSNDGHMHVIVKSRLYLKQQFYSLWFDQTGDWTYVLPKSREAWQPLHPWCGSYVNIGLVQSTLIFCTELTQKPLGSTRQYKNYMLSSQTGWSLWNIHFSYGNEHLFIFTQIFIFPPSPTRLLPDLTE